MRMPDNLKKFLTNTTLEESEQLWEYFDETSDIESEMIDVLIKEHPPLESPREKKPERNAGKKAT